MKVHKDLERDCTGSSGFCFASFPFSFKLFCLPRIGVFMNVCCCCIIVLEVVSSLTMLSSALQLMSKLCLKCFVKTSRKLYAAEKRNLSLLRICIFLSMFIVTTNQEYLFVRLCCFLAALFRFYCCCQEYFFIICQV